MQEWKIYMLNVRVIDTHISHFLSFRLCVADGDKGDRQKHTACVGESCLSSWIDIQSFAPSICQVRPLWLHWGLSLSTTLSQACNCSVIQTPVSHSISPFSLPQRRLKTRDAEEGTALLQPTHCVYIQQINTNMAGGYETLPGARTQQQLSLTSHIQRKKKGKLLLWPRNSLALAWFCLSERPRDAAEPATILYTTTVI